MSKVYLSYQDFPNICRVCLQRDDNLRNFTDLKITDLYKLLTNIEVKGDTFPSKICKNCKSRLDGINVFIEQCKSNEELLKKIPPQKENVVEIYDLDNFTVTHGVEESDLFNTNVIILEDKDVYSCGFNLTNGRPTPKGRTCLICGEHISPEDKEKHYKLSPKCIPDDFKCPECKKSFYLKSRLEKHMRTHVKKDSAAYTCLQCNEKFTSAKSLTEHARVHKGEKPFRCEICGNGYTKKNSLEEHMNFHTGNRPYVCEYCGFKYGRRADYNGHIYRTHSRISENIPKSETKYTEQNCGFNLTNGGTCLICGEHVSPEDKEKHYKLSPKCIPDDFKCPECKKPFYLKSRLERHMRTHVKKTAAYTCLECNKKFTSAKSLTEHARVHTGEKPFRCEICDNGYMKKRSLEDHMNFHTGNRPYVCEYCGFKYGRRSDYNAHIYRTHNGILETIPKPQRKYIEKRVHLKLECKICGKILTSRYGYAHHQLGHQGIKRFLCNVCGKRFIAGIALRTHMRSHTGEKPFSCECCGKCFSQRSTLNVHIASHGSDGKISKNRPKTHKCSECHMSFVYLSMLKVHLRTHTGEKIYTCSYCGKKLSSTSTLRVHKRTHTGETPYVCSVCQKGFHDSSNLNQHFRRHHGGEQSGAKSKTKISLF